MAQVFENLIVFSENQKRISQVKSQIDSLLQCVPILWKMVQSDQRLLQAGNRFSIG